MQSIAFISKSDKQEKCDARRGLRSNDFWNLTKAGASHVGDDLVLMVAIAARSAAVRSTAVRSADCEVGRGVEWAARGKGLFTRLRCGLVFAEACSLACAAGLYLPIGAQKKRDREVAFF